MTGYKGPERQDTSDGYLQAVEKAQDEARELQARLKEFLEIPETATSSNLSMVKELIGVARDALKKETLRDRFAQAALTGLLAAGNDALGAYSQAERALLERDPGESEDE